MAYRRFEIENLGKITVYKRRGIRNVRLSVTHGGDVRVSLPVWAPYKLGIEFVKNKHQWIQKQQQPKGLLSQDTRVGKNHTLYFLTKPSSSKITTRVTATEIRVFMPLSMNISHSLVQEAAEKACVKALKKQAAQLLPRRIEKLAMQHGFVYSGIAVKQLKRRWGSCNEKKEIVANCFLMQLPWELIDYVLLHELMHTRIMAHGPKFWQELAQLVPNLPECRRVMRSKKPILLLS
jgi:hypothetical protein